MQTSEKNGNDWADTCQGVSYRRCSEVLTGPISMRSSMSELRPQMFDTYVCMPTQLTVTKYLPCDLHGLSHLSWFHDEENKARLHLPSFTGEMLPHLCIAAWSWDSWGQCCLISLPLTSHPFCLSIWFIQSAWSLTQLLPPWPAGSLPALVYTELVAAPGSCSNPGWCRGLSLLHTGVCWASRACEPHTLPSPAGFHFV